MKSNMWPRKKYASQTSQNKTEKKEAGDMFLHILSFWTYFADAAPLLNNANHHENISLHF